MKGRIDEGRITGAIDAISLENIDKITKQMKTCICQVKENKLELVSLVK